MDAGGRILSGGNVGEALSILEEKPDGSRQETALEQILRVSRRPRRGIRCSGNAQRDFSGSAEQILYSAWNAISSNACW